MINKTLNKWEQQVQAGVLARLKGKETALTWAPQNKSKKTIKNYMQPTTRNPRWVSMHINVKFNYHNNRKNAIYSLYVRRLQQI